MVDGLNKDASKLVAGIRDQNMAWQEDHTERQNQMIKTIGDLKTLVVTEHGKPNETAEALRRIADVLERATVKQ